MRRIFFFLKKFNKIITVLFISQRLGCIFVYFSIDL